MTRAVLGFACLLAFLATRSADAVIIDVFTDTQTLTLPSSPSVGDDNTSVVEASLGDILGTERDTRLMKSGDSSASANVSGGQLSALMGIQATGDVTVQWDGALDGTKNLIDTDGLSITDLTDSSTSNAISASITNGLTSVTMTFTVWTDEGADNSSDRTIVVPPLFSGTQSFLFNDFSVLTGTGANFTRATAVQLDLSLPGGSTIDVDLIETSFVAENSAIPEPGTFSLLVLGGLCLLRRRRRAG